MAHTEPVQSPTDGTSAPSPVLEPAASVAESDFTFYLGICDECRTIQTFTSEQARNQWEAGHHE